jgi:DNA-binding HxlR family transcriptional regulator
MDGSRRPSDLERRLPEIPHAAIMRRLAELRERGLPQHVRYSGLSPTSEYTVTRWSDGLSRSLGAGMEHRP